MFLCPVKHITKIDKRAFKIGAIIEFKEISFLNKKLLDSDSYVEVNKNLKVHDEV